MMNNPNIKTEHRECKKHGLTLYKKYSNSGYKCCECMKEHSRKAKGSTLNKTTIAAYKTFCFICGYDKNKASLDFHHKNKLEKDFTISITYRRIGNKKLIEEIEKCIVLCANCHRLEHYKENNEQMDTCNKHTNNKYSCKECNPHRQRWKRQQFKKELVELFGNKCFSCQETYPVIIYDFHHLKPSQKIYNVSDLIAAFNYIDLQKEIENLILLCVNCHREETAQQKIIISNIPITQQQFFNHFLKDKLEERKEKKKLKEVNSTCKCGNTKIHYSEQCITCYYASRPQKIDWPTIEELVTALQIKPYTRLAKELNVSDNAIRKHLKKHNIDPKTLKPFKENLQNYKP